MTPTKRIPHGFELRLRRLRQRLADWLERNADAAVFAGMYAAAFGLLYWVPLLGIGA